MNIKQAKEHIKKFRSFIFKKRMNLAITAFR